MLRLSGIGLSPLTQVSNMPQREQGDMIYCTEYKVGKESGQVKFGISITTYLPYLQLYTTRECC